MSHTCTVDDVRWKRRKLEYHLNRLISDGISSFQKETGVPVSSVRVDLVRVHVLGRLDAMHVVTSVAVDLHL